MFINAIGYGTSVIGGCIIAAVELDLIQIGATADRACSLVGVLLLIGGLVYVVSATEPIMINATKILESESDRILRDSRYEEALRLVTEGRELDECVEDSAIAEGVEYLIRNGVEESDATKNLNIVIGSLVLAQSKG